MAYFDKDGFVVETSTRMIENVPMIQGLACDEVVLFEKLPIGNQQLRDMLTLTQTLKREKMVPDGIHFGLDVSPVLYYDNTAIWLGSMELLTQKVERLNEIFPSIQGIEGVLHMENWTEETANIIFEKAVQVPEEDTENEGESEAENDTENQEELESEGDTAESETPQDAESEEQKTEEETPNAEDDAQN